MIMIIIMNISSIGDHLLHSDGSDRVILSTSLIRLPSKLNVKINRLWRRADKIEFTNVP